MDLVTLLTDYNYKDFYLAKVKIRVQKMFPKRNVLDICHGISSYNLNEASYNFNALLTEFDSTDLHFIFINIHYDKNYKIIVAQTKENGTIVAPNNGILGLLKCEYVSFHELELSKSSFVELDILKELQDFDSTKLKTCEAPYLAKALTPRVSEKELKGDIIYIDVYGNNVTNITQKDFESFVNNEPYFIQIKRNTRERVDKDYSDNWGAGHAAFFNSQGYLEISSVHANASEMFNLKYVSKIIIKKG